MIYDLPHRKFCPFCMLTVFTPNLLSPLSGTNSVIPAMITLGKITAIPSPLRIYIRSAPEHRKILLRHLFCNKPAGYPRPWSESYSEVSSILSSNTLFSGKTMFAFFNGFPIPPANTPATFPPCASESAKPLLHRTESLQCAGNSCKSPIHPDRHPFAAESDISQSCLSL